MEPAVHLGEIDFIVKELKRRRRNTPNWVTRWLSTENVIRAKINLPEISRGFSRWRSLRVFLPRASPEPPPPRVSPWRPALFPGPSVRFTLLCGQWARGTAEDLELLPPAPSGSSASAPGPLPRALLQGSPHVTPTKGFP